MDSPLAHRERPGDVAARRPQDAPRPLPVASARLDQAAEILVGGAPCDGRFGLIWPVASWPTGTTNRLWLIPARRSAGTCSPRRCTTSARATAGFPRGCSRRLRRGPVGHCWEPARSSREAARALTFPFRKTDPVSFRVPLVSEPARLPRGAARALTHCPRLGFAWPW